MKKKTAIIVMTAYFVVFSQNFQLIPSLIESGSVVNNTFFNAAAAYPANPSSMSLNPSAPAMWHYFTEGTMSVFSSYDSRYTTAYNTGGGVSVAIGSGKYIGAEYGVIKDNNANIRSHRTTVAFGTIIDDNHDDMLFVGANISHHFQKADTTDNVLVADIGFYQPGDGTGFSWGVVLENIFGYHWSSGEERKYNDIMNKRYNSILVSSNLSLPLLDEKLILMAPFDVRFWGFMNRDLRKSSSLKHRTEVHGGFEAQYNQVISGRFGWAWIPDAYKTDENGQLNYTGWENRFSGGFGINIKRIFIDGYLAKNAWGAGFALLI